MIHSFDSHGQMRCRVRVAATQWRRSLTPQLARVAFGLLLIAAAPSAAAESVVVWGHTSFGQANVPAGLGNVVSLAGGDHHILALQEDGAVAAWGGNYSGQTNVPSGLNDVVSIAAGSTHSLALRSDGTVALWGRMLTGVTNVPPEATNVVALALGPGAWHALALRADGSLLDWGYPGHGLTNIPPLATNIVAVTVGAFHSLALRSDGRVVAWGDNTYGATSVPADATNIVAISAGWHHSVGLRSDGAVLIWGSRFLGGPLANSSVLAALAASSCGMEIASGGNHFLVLARDGSVLSWGDNEYGQASVPTAASKAVSIAGTSYNSLAVVDGKAPVFKTPAMNRTVVAGSTACFRMFAVGARPLSYQWTCNGTNLPGATNLVLTVPDALPKQSGNMYSIVASNTFGAVTSAPMALIVKPVEAVVQPNDLRVLPGTSVNFDAIAIGTGPFSYQWQADGTNLVSATNASLVLTNLQLADAATFAVEVSNSHGSAISLEASLRVVPLIISTQPAGRTVPAGTNVTFAVAVTGQGPFSYQWRFNGISLSGETDASLELADVQLNHAGKYSVIVSNLHGAATSTDAVLNVSPLLFASAPKSQTVPVGTNVTFSSVAAGEGPFHYQWRFENVDLDGATSSALALNDVQLGQAGGYSLVVTNSYGSVTSAVAMLQVAPLLITSQPQNRIVVPGANVTFSVTAAGQQPFSYQWRHGGTNIDGATSDSIMLTNIQPQLSEVISVVVSNVYGAVTSAPALLSIVPLTITSPPQSGSVPAGFNTSFSVGVSGEGPFYYQWEFDGTILTNQTNSSLVLTSVQPNQAGTYSVTVSNAYGPVTSRAALLSVSPFLISSQPQNKNVLAGDSTSFGIGTTGLGPFNYQWRFNGQDLPRATNKVLFLSDLQPSAAGEYSVVVSNPYGSATSSSAQLTILPLQITGSLQSKSAFLGGSMTWTVTAQANQPITFQWHHNGDLLAGATDASLSLTNLQFTDAGLYSVILSNVYGTVSNGAQLSITTIAAWGEPSTGNTSLPPGLTNALAIGVGRDHSLAVRTDGTVVSWGNLVPSPMPEDLNDAIAVAGGQDHSVALRSDGTVVAWGDDRWGQTDVPAGLVDAVSIASGDYHTLALRKGGTVVAWGDNSAGQTNVPAGLGNVVAIAAGWSHNLAVRRDGSVVAWGSNDAGQCDVPPGLSNVTGVAAGYRHSLALKNVGTVVAWGLNTEGQTNVPPGLSNVIAVAAGDYYYSLALQADGTLVGWGSGIYGLTSPPAELRNVVALAAAEFHVLALIGDGPPVRSAFATNPLFSPSGFSLSRNDSVEHA